ncbi:sugar transporter SWEET1-like isoform X2 [Acropora palmata]|uniref:sugar transporter SWEET1-like isoform X2 n=1 Tax=Acropora palmata TaxID=6131 RepID=UPI003DA17C72
MDIKHIVSWSATLSQFGLLSTGISVCLKIRQQGSTKNITSFPFFTTCLSSTLWTKYGILTNDTALCVVGVAGIVLQSIYLASILLSKYRGKDSLKNEEEFGNTREILERDKDSVISTHPQ